jgi:hypothetical protein
MNLLFFYLEQIFLSFSFPLPSQICSGDQTMLPMCKASVSFALISGLLILITLTIIIIRSFKLNFKFIPSLVFLLLLSFFLADYSVKQIQNPVVFGIEWFVLLYYLWCFILTLIFLLNLYFPKSFKKTLFSAIILTLIFTFLFAYKGRGNVEQITILIGGLLAEFSISYLLLSSSAKFIIGLFLVTIIFSLVETIAVWIKTGDAKFKNFLTSLKIFSAYLIIIILPAISIPIGEYFNKQDVKDAKEFIDNVKIKADKFYFENGEYPKFIEDMLPSEKSPRILARHEYFTQGIRGTYYFSREDKYCFLFQNPNRKFGYYSITSERGWRFSRDNRDYASSFIALCDESNKSADSLISNHLGVESEDEMVNRIAADIGAASPNILPLTPVTSQKLKEKMGDESLEENSQKTEQKPEVQQNPVEMIKKLNSEEFKEEIKNKLLQNPEFKKFLEQYKQQQTK